MPHYGVNLETFFSFELNVMNLGVKGKLLKCALFIPETTGQDGCIRQKAAKESPESDWKVLLILSVLPKQSPG